MGNVATTASWLSARWVIKVACSLAGVLAVVLATACGVVLGQPVVVSAAGESASWLASAPTLAVAVLVLLVPIVLAMHRAEARRWLPWIVLIGAISLGVVAGVKRCLVASPDYVASLPIMTRVGPARGKPLGALANPDRWSRLPTLVFSQDLFHGMQLHRRCYAGYCDVRLFRKSTPVAKALRGDRYQQHWFGQDEQLEVRLDTLRGIWIIKGKSALVAFDGYTLKPRAIHRAHIASGLAPSSSWLGLAWGGVALALALLWLRTAAVRRLDTIGHAQQASLGANGWLLRPDGLAPARLDDDARCALEPGPVLLMGPVHSRINTYYRAHSEVGAAALCPGPRDHAVEQQQKRIEWLELGVLVTLAISHAPLVAAAVAGLL